MSPEGNEKNSNADDLSYKGNHSDQQSEKVGQEGNEPKPLTTEDVKAMLAEHDDVVVDKAARKAQSSFDQRSSKFEEKLTAKVSAIDQTVAMMAKNGNPMPPEQINTLKHQAVIEATAEAKPGSPSKEDLSAIPNAGQTKPSVEEMAVTSAKMIQFINNSGVELTPEEVKLIKTDAPNAATYEASVRQAVTTAQARVQAEEQENKSPAIPGTGVSIPNSLGRKISSDAAEKELADLIQHPTAQNMARIKELREKLVQKLK